MVQLHDQKLDELERRVEILEKRQTRVGMHQQQKYGGFDEIWDQINDITNVIPILLMGATIGFIIRLLVKTKSKKGE